MGKVIDMDEHIPYLTGELICVRCGYRGLNSWPEVTWLKQLECPECHNSGYMIGTGQLMPSPEEKPYGPYAKPTNKPGIMIEFPKRKGES